MTEEQRAARIRALVEERAGYERRGDSDRAAGVSVELQRLGAEGTAPVKRAAKRVVKGDEVRA